MRHTVWTMILLVLCGCGVNVAERNNAANWYASQEQYNTAIQAYQVAQVNAPDEAMPYFNASLAYEAMEDIDQAILAYEQAILRGNATTQEQAYYNLGNLYFRQGLYDDAVSAYKQALRLNPTNDNARFNLELALQYSINPTPTPIEMQSNPEQGQADASATPSPNPAGQQPPTPTPTPPPAQPIASTPKESGDTGERVENEFATPKANEQGELSVEKALEILNETEHQQQNIGKLRPPQLSDLTPTSVKDW